jgi:signal peptidase II
MTPERRKWVLFGVLGTLSLALDQWTKALARAALDPDKNGYSDGIVKVVVDGFFKLRYSENTGVAFGLFQSDHVGVRIVLTAVALLAFGLVIHYMRKTEVTHTRMHAALGLVGGGAIGNLTDRILFGRVTDFIVWHYKNHEWPAFNIADAALVVGVGLMALDMIKAPRPAAVAETQSPKER